MHELRRQSYLTSMGIESYIPRMLLVQAPTPQLCELPVADDSAIAPVRKNLSIVSDAENAPIKNITAEQSVQEILKTMDIGVKPTSAVTQKSVAQKNETKSIKPQENTAIKPFVLTVWRPREDYLIIDASEQGAALPTHQLLQNILCCLLGKDILIGEGDRVKFPLIENPHGGNTSKYMRDSLQTWFSAEYEKRPSPNVWLMGENTVQYLLPNESDYSAVLWKSHTLPICENDPASKEFTAKILPSLSDLLLTPMLKAKLWQQFQG